MRATPNTLFVYQWREVRAECQPTNQGNQRGTWRDDQNQKAGVEEGALEGYQVSARTEYIVTYQTDQLAKCRGESLGCEKGWVGAEVSDYLAKAFTHQTRSGGSLSRGGLSIPVKF